MKSVKDEIRELIARMPDEATLEDVQHHLYIRQKIRAGLADVQADRLLSHDEVEKRLARWLGE